MIRQWIPNILTMGNLSLGFLSILLVARADSYINYDNHQIFFIASILIFMAALFDGVDGLVARLLKVESELGKQLDTLADLVTFGIAPGVLVYVMFLGDTYVSSQYFTIPAGTIIATTFPLSAAFRLARFNVTESPGYFAGLPSPIAGVGISLLGMTGEYYEIPQHVTIVITLTLAVLMSSNIRYSKPQVSLRQHFTKFRLALLFTLIIVAMFKFGFYWTVLTTLCFYIISGIIVLPLHMLQKLRVVLGKINEKTNQRKKRKSKDQNSGL